MFSQAIVWIYIWIGLFSLVGMIAFSHLWIKKKGLPCYMAYLTLMMVSSFIVACVNLYGKYLQTNAQHLLDEFSHSTLWHIRLVPYGLIVTCVAIHVIYKNYLWKGYTGLDRRKPINRRGGIK